VPLFDLNFLNGLSASVQEVQIGGTSKQDPQGSAEK
jgi:hypothetical protein